MFFLLCPHGSIDDLYFFFACSISNDGTKFYLQTNKDAPQYRVVSFDLADPTSTFHEFLPEDNNALLEVVKAIGDKFIVIYKRNVRSLYRIQLLPRSWLLLV